MSNFVMSLILFVQIFLKQDTYGKRLLDSFAGLINLGISFLVVYFWSVFSLKEFFLLFSSGVFLLSGIWLFATERVIGVGVVGYFCTQNLLKVKPDCF